MITYKIDKHMQVKSGTQLKEMSDFLADVAPNLSQLQKLLREHEIAISSTTINRFRAELIDMVNEAIDVTAALAENTNKLVAVSDQAAKHLSAMDEHFGAILFSKTPQTQQQPQPVA